MAYDRNDPGKFHSDFDAASTMASQMHPNMYRPVKPDAGWRLYCNASRPHLKLHVFGRHVGRPEDWAAGKIGIDLFTMQPGQAIKAGITLR